MQGEIGNAYDKWVEGCKNSTTSDTYGGCAWDMISEAIVQAHTGGSSIENAHQYGKTTVDLISIPLGFLKAGKIGQLNKLVDMLDPFNQVIKYASKGVKVAFNGVGKAGKKSFIYIFNQARKLEKYEVLYHTGNLYAGIPISEFRKKVDDTLKKTKLEDLPQDEHGIRILEVDGEVIPIGPEAKIDEILAKTGGFPKYSDEILETWAKFSDNVADVADAGIKNWKTFQNSVGKELRIKYPNNKIGDQITLDVHYIDELGKSKTVTIIPDNLIQFEVNGIKKYKVIDVKTSVQKDLSSVHVQPIKNLYIKFWMEMLAQEVLRKWK